MTDSDNIIPMPDMKGIEAEAAGWVARFEDGTHSEADSPEFQTWYNQSESHKEAYHRLASLWSSLDMASELKDYAAVTIADMEASKGSFRALLSRRNALTAMAASFAGAIGTGVVYNIVQTQRDVFNGAYETELGEQRNVMLPDGSSIDLNTNSRVEVDFDGARRRIRLARGEAFFNVAPNKERPFSVYAAGGVVTAVGTAFAVKLAEGKRLDVLVTEGVVALTAQTPESGSALVDQPVQSAVARPQLKVSAGQHAVFEDDVGHVKQANIAGLERKLMWRSGMLAYDGEPLSEVVADVSRYAPVNIEIEDEALKRVPVAGFFRVGEVDMMLEGLSAIADIEVTHVSPREIRLSKKNKG